MMCKVRMEGVMVKRSSTMESKVLLFGFVLGKHRPIREVDLEVLGRLQWADDVQGRR
jgi:hypothetical protein